MEQYAQAPANTESNLFELQFDHESTSFLSETAKWAKFLSIVGFVFTGILVLVAFFLGKLLGSLSPFGAALSGVGFLSTVFYLGLAALIFFPNWFLFNYARKIQTAFLHNDQATLNASLGSMKSYFKFMGILTIVILSIYIIFIILIALR
jgi:hypothetical protein